jgi:putative hydrolase of the HAD superfamily
MDGSSRGAEVALRYKCEPADRDMTMIEGARDFERHGSFPPSAHEDTKEHRPLLMSAQSGVVDCVFFDLGGVVFGSPLVAISQYAKEVLSIPPRELAAAFVRSPSFEKLEEGGLSLEEFFPLFEQECVALGLTKVNAVTLFARMENALVVNHVMLAEIRQLRGEGGYKVAAITNNWRNRTTDKHGNLGSLRQEFDEIIESCVERVRKPNACIFESACRRMNAHASRCVFLDDIGINLKAAQSLGMKTIKVSPGELGTNNALDQLRRTISRTPSLLSQL